MTEGANSRTVSARTVTWTLFAAVPALAIAALGTGLLSGSLTSAVPPSGSVEETRAFSAKGDDLAAMTGVKADASDEASLSQWQNTVRRRPSPRR